MQFKPDNINNSIEKQNLWNEWAFRVERIIDKLGKRIDPGIRESVIVFNVLDIRTSGSCEGHLDGKSPYPFVDIEPISKESLIEKFPNYEKILEIRKENKYRNPQEFKQNSPLLYEESLIISSHISKIKQELGNKIIEFLNEFYSSHTPYSPEGKIEAHESAGSGFRVEMANSRGLGLDNWKRFDDKISNIGIEQKKIFLENNQREMKAFTNFLKNKFFNLK